MILKRTIFVCILILCLVGCKASKPRGHIYVSLVVVDVLQDYIWKNGTLPKSYDQIQSQCESFPDPNRPKPGDKIRWEPSTASDKKQSEDGRDGKIVIFISGNEFKFEEGMELDINYLAKSDPWYVHYDHLPNYEQQIVKTERNLANFVAVGYKDYAELHGNRLPISLDYLVNQPLFGDYQKLNINKLFTAEANIDDKHQLQVKVKSLESGKLYNYATVIEQ